MTRQNARKQEWVFRYKVVFNTWWSECRPIAPLTQLSQMHYREIYLSKMASEKKLLRPFLLL